jgi:hypothetical protein
MTNRNKKDVHKHAVKYVDNFIIKGTAMRNWTPVH